MKFEDAKVSVVIPIYNSEKYLNMCIESIIKQTYKNLEIILINDGSKDSSLDICRKYSNIDSRIILIDNKNKGVGYSRNCGIKNATGKYIMFIDSDDVCKSTMIEKLISRINNKIDLVICGIEFFNEYPKIISEKYYNEDVMSTEEYLNKILIREKIGQFCGGPYNKIFKTEIIKNNNVLFREDTNYAEDFIFNLDYLINVNNIYIEQQCLYMYRCNSENSLTFKNYSKFKKETFLKQRIDAYSKFENIYKFYNAYEKNYNEIVVLFKKYILSTISMSCKYSIDKVDTQAFIKSICKEKNYTKYISNGYGLNFFDKIILWLVRNKKEKIIYFLEKLKHNIVQAIK